MTGRQSGPRVAPQGPPLDTYADKSSPLRESGSETASRRRYRGRALLWSESTLGRVRACGRCRRKDVQQVRVRGSEHGPGLTGLQQCGMVWICPVCSSRIWAERCLEIGLVASAHVGQGGRVAMVTFTTRHRFADRLDGLVKHLRSGWRAVWDGKAGKELRQDLQLVGYVRVLEINYGANGWHPHYHLALLLPPGMSQERIEGLLVPAFDRWSRAVVRSGGRLPLRQAQDVRLFGPQDVDRLAEYLTEAFFKGAPQAAPTDRGRTEGRPQSVGAAADALGLALGREMTQAARKAARSRLGTRPHWRLLDDVIDLGDADALDLWHEMERATKNVRGIVWSKGLRALYGLGAERTDQEIVDEELSGRDYCVLTEDGLRTLLGRVYAVPEMQEAWKAGRWPAVAKWLQDNGIEYVPLDEEGEES